ncbi:hypothetical protein CPB83DRAFT_833650 [Crepidotus variabilis]|uniref:Uncharacterized protein n=1 Tax=Crepidotus variabilis TaxID=179855 RepID=A0A9P6EMJ7_9AGAR|nr:hypothetical protein CPB83DRAFT_833650 [Crepidotus variabilis]
MVLKVALIRGSADPYVQRRFLAQAIGVQLPLANITHAACEWHLTRGEKWKAQVVLEFSSTSEEKQVHLQSNLCYRFSPCKSALQLQSTLHLANIAASSPTALQTSIIKFHSGLPGSFLKVLAAMSEATMVVHTKVFIVSPAVLSPICLVELPAWDSSSGPPQYSATAANVDNAYDFYFLLLNSFGVSSRMVTGLNDSSTEPEQISYRWERHMHSHIGTHVLLTNGLAYCVFSGRFVLANHIYHGSRTSIDGCGFKYKVLVISRFDVCSALANINTSCLMGHNVPVVSTLSPRTKN